MIKLTYTNTMPTLDTIEHAEIKFVDKKEFFEMDLTKLSKEAGRILFDSYFIFLRKGD